MNKKIATKDSWKTKEMPNENKELNFEFKLTLKDLKILKKGHIPEAMEDHWFMYFENNKFYIHRSWTGFCIFIVDVPDTGIITKAIVNQSNEYLEENDNSNIYLIKHLIYATIGKFDEALEMLNKMHDLH